MGKRIVIALGGNALGNNLAEQKQAVAKTSAAIADLIEQGHSVTVSHGNGPQVGMIHLAMEKQNIPLPVCGAMSQAYIGCDLQNALGFELKKRGIIKTVSTIVTQVVVSEKDEAFLNPTKPIGSFMDEKAAEKLRDEGITVVEDAGRGYRRVVASPMPISIVEIEAVRALNASGQIVIAAGGGGIPVIEKADGSLERVSAVIDKDFASQVLARELDADFLIILTAVEKVAINFNKENQQWLTSLTIDEANKLIQQGHFAPGSMLPKIQAAVSFASGKKGRKALITLLEKASDGIEGKTGTLIFS